MKRPIVFVLVLVVAVVTLAMAVTTLDRQTLSGEYEWSRGGDSGTLEASFVPTGEGTWDVSFRFEFRESTHVYSGSAHGSLTDGALVGDVENDDGRRSFEFRGAFVDGVFTGTHAETTEGRENETGTLILRR